MKKLITHLLFVFFSSNMMAQNTCIFEAKINNLPNTRIYLYNYEGDRNQLLDSASTDQSGYFRFLLNPNWQPGFYKVEIGIDMQQRRPYSFNFIYNAENISLLTTMPELTDSMRVSVSIENQLYFAFNKFNDNILAQLAALFELKNVFPANDPFYATLKDKYELLQSDYQSYFDSLYINNQNSIAMQVIKISRFPVVSFSTPNAEARDYLVSHYFDYTDFNKPQLLRTNLFTSKAFSYIQMYRNPKLDKKNQEAEFIKATDIVLKAAAINKTVQLQITDFLVRGFETVGMDELLTRIANNYMEETGCTDGNSSISLKNKLAGYTKMAVGKTVPDIIMNCSDQGNYNLYQSTASYTLIIFWASWCPHCLATLPEIKKVCEGLNGETLDVVAISIDTSAIEWCKAIKEGNFTWRNCCDLKGWNGNAAKNYSVTATPALFLVDRHKKIIAKPMTGDELLLKLQELGVQ